MAYRDRPPACPRCGVDLVRRRTRDVWCCPRCAGMQMAAAEVERRLRLLAPDISEEIIREVMTARRPRAAAIARRGQGQGQGMACPSCRRPMQPVVMGGVHVARCDPDDQIWFDATELDRVLARAGEHHRSQRSWIARLFSHLFASQS